MSLPGKKWGLLVKKYTVLTFFIIIACVLVAGCTTPTIKEIKPVTSPSPTVTPSLLATTPDVTVTPVQMSNSTEIKKGQVNVSIGNYVGELPVFIDNKTAGNVTLNKPLNTTVNVGRHAVRICVRDLCKTEEIVVLSSGPATVDFGEWLTKEIVTGPLTISLGGYNADLPILVDNITVGNLSQGELLNLMVSEGNHTVKVCVGMICVNETVGVKFAKPANVDFGDRLRKVAEFSTPTARIVNTRQAGARVMVDMEFINPLTKDITFTTMVQCTYTYIDPQGRKGNFKQITVTKSVRPGMRANHTADIYLDGGRSYVIEAPHILETTFK